MISFRGATWIRPSTVLYLIPMEVGVHVGLLRLQYFGDPLPEGWGVRNPVFIVANSAVLLTVAPPRQVLFSTFPFNHPNKSPTIGGSPPCFSMFPFNHPTSVGSPKQTSPPTWHGIGSNPWPEPKRRRLPIGTAQDCGCLELRPYLQLTSDLQRRFFVFFSFALKASLWNHPLESPPPWLILMGCTREMWGIRIAFGARPAPFLKSKRFTCPW